MVSKLSVKSVEWNLRNVFDQLFSFIYFICKLPLLLAPQVLFVLVRLSSLNHHMILINR